MWRLNREDKELKIDNLTYLSEILENKVITSFASSILNRESIKCTAEPASYMLTAFN